MLLQKPGGIISLLDETWYENFFTITVTLKQCCIWINVFPNSVSCSYVMLMKCNVFFLISLHSWHFLLYSMFPKSTHETFAQKLYQTFKDHKRFVKPKLARTEFTIVHYAGEVSYESSFLPVKSLSLCIWALLFHEYFQVQYQCDLFLDKNKDYIVPEHQELLSTSKCSFISRLFPSLNAETPKSGKFSSIGSRFKVS